MSGELDTETQVVKVRTPRGVLTIGPHGRIQGLERIIQRELRTNEQVRAMCAKVKRRRGKASTAPVDRNTLRAWRAREDFPAPWLTVPLGAATVELWSRSEVEGWMETREARTLELERASLGLPTQRDVEEEEAP